jgi:hypothetical protein
MSNEPEVDVIKSEYLKKHEREMSKVGQKEMEIGKDDEDADFSDNSETVREKNSKRPPTGSQS